ASSCVALIDFDRDFALALQTSERLQQIFPRKISIAGIGSELDAGLLLQAMRSGCAEFLTKPVEAVELSASLARFHQSGTMTGAAQRSGGRVLLLAGAKGGVGTTTLAVHLAIHLAHRNQRTLLIDLKPQLGHVALHLGLKDTMYHFDELLRNADRLDAELLRGFVVRHGSGVEVVASPEAGPAHSEDRNAAIERVMDFLRREYDCVLIDSPPGQSRASSVFEQADEVYLVSTPDVAALRDLARMVEHLSLNDLAVGKMRLVLNRSTADDPANAEQIEKAVHLPVSVAVPDNARELLRAVNEGQPVQPHRRSEFNRALARWSSQAIQSGSAAEMHGAARKRFAFWR
ncbi:MAG TPA: AAA family ATPase, partial [Acidobacteriaceae bacterium]|nr:AAA family ATPase [Acidobacteriaceae bacterium]